MYYFFAIIVLLLYFSFRVLCKFDATILIQDYIFLNCNLKFEKTIKLLGIEHMIVSIVIIIVGVGFKALSFYMGFILF